MEQALMLARTRQGLSRWRRTLAESVGNGRYSYVALNDIDRKLERYLDKDDGFFIEAGANDGFKQSNTYFFEKIRGWHGVLIEPIPELFEQCRRRRPNSHVVQAALVSNEFAAATIQISYADLMSVTAGALGSEDAAHDHILHGLTVQNLGASYTIDVPARTLTSILESAGVDRRIDLLSLDVEGFEASALRGLDFQRYKPRYLCIEVRDRAEISEIVEPLYREAEILHDAGSYQDILFAAADDG